MRLFLITAQTHSFSTTLFKLLTVFHLYAVRRPSLRASSNSMSLCLLKQYRINCDWRQGTAAGIGDG